MTTTALPIPSSGMVTAKATSVVCDLKDPSSSPVHRRHERSLVNVAYSKYFIHSLVSAHGLLACVCIARNPHNCCMPLNADRMDHYLDNDHYFCCNYYYSMKSCHDAIQSTTELKCTLYSNRKYVILLTTVQTS